jgi:hypothetical protein
MELGDFVCPRFYKGILASSGTASIYQVTKIGKIAITAQKVCDPNCQIRAPKDFFIKLE